MERARRQGQKIGRPKVTDRKGFNARFGDRRRAAKELNVGYATLKRLLDAQPRTLNREAGS